MKNKQILLASTFLVSQIVLPVNAGIVEQKVDQKIIESILNDINILENVKPVVRINSVTGYVYIQG